METTNVDRARNALIGIVEIAEHDIRCYARLSEHLHSLMLSKSASNKIIANRCENTAKLIGEKL